MTTDKMPHSTKALYENQYRKSIHVIGTDTIKCHTPLTNLIENNHMKQQHKYSKPKINILCIQHKGKDCLSPVVMFDI